MSYSSQFSGLGMDLTALLHIVVMFLGYFLFSWLFSPTLGWVFIWFSLFTYLIVSFIKKEIIVVLTRFPSFRYGGNRSRWTSGLFLLAIIIVGVLSQPHLENLKTPYIFVVLIVAGLVGYLHQRLLSKYLVFDSIV